MASRRPVLRTTPQITSRTLLLLVFLLPWSLLRAEDIPLENCDRLLVAQVRISGMKFLFLVDTAAVSMLNLKSFAHGEPIKAAVKSWNGTVETNAQDVTVGDLQVGRHHFKNLRLTAVDLSAIGMACGRRIDGILGIDLLAQLGATVDLKNRTARLAADVETAQERAAELDRQLMACQQAFNRADEAAFADCFDPQVVMFAVGGDYYGRDAVLEYHRNRYFRQNPPAQLSFHPRAYHAIGEAIWVEYDLHIDLSNQQVIAARGTALCQKEDGKWRVVHMNHSIPPANTLNTAEQH
ncbi:MAG TPA: nuclear transport factor 2 family protein [Candidatus Angelobacter sp.]